MQNQNVPKPHTEDVTYPQHDIMKSLVETYRTKGGVEQSLQRVLVDMFQAYLSECERQRSIIIPWYRISRIDYFTDETEQQIEVDYENRHDFKTIKIDGEEELNQIFDMVKEFQSSWIKLEAPNRNVELNLRSSNFRKDFIFSLFLLMLEFGLAINGQDIDNFFAVKHGRNMKTGVYHIRCSLLIANPLSAGKTIDEVMFYGRDVTISKDGVRFSGDGEISGRFINQEIVVKQELHIDDQSIDQSQEIQTQSR